MVFCRFGLIAFGVLEVAAGEKMRSLVGHSLLTAILHTVFSVTGSLTIFQSFTLKLSDFKIMDMGRFVDNFRNEFKASIAERAAQIQRARNLKFIDKLAQVYRGKEEELLGPLTTALSNAGVDAARMKSELDVIRTYCKSNRSELSRG